MRVCHLVSVLSGLLVALALSHAAAVVPAEHGDAVHHGLDVAGPADSSLVLSPREDVPRHRPYVAFVHQTRLIYHLAASSFGAHVAIPVLKETVKEAMQAVIALYTLTDWVPRDRALTLNDRGAYRIVMVTGTRVSLTWDDVRAVLDLILESLAGLPDTGATWTFRANLDPERFLGSRSLRAWLFLRDRDMQAGQRSLVRGLAPASSHGLDQTDSPPSSVVRREQTLASSSHRVRLARVMLTFVLNPGPRLLQMAAAGLSLLIDSALERILYQHSWEESVPRSHSQRLARFDGFDLFLQTGTEADLLWSDISESLERIMLALESILEITMPVGLYVNIDPAERANVERRSWITVHRAQAAHRRATSPLLTAAQSAVAPREPTGPYHIYHVPGSNARIAFSTHAARGIVAVTLAALREALNVAITDVRTRPMRAFVPSDTEVLLGHGASYVIALSTVTVPMLRWRDILHSLFFLLDNVAEPLTGTYLSMFVLVDYQLQGAFQTRASLAVTPLRPLRRRARAEPGSATTTAAPAFAIAPREGLWRYRPEVIPNTHVAMAWSLHAGRMAIRLSSAILTSVIFDAHSAVQLKSLAGRIPSGVTVLLAAKEHFKIVLKTGASEIMTWSDLQHCLEFVLGRLLATAPADILTFFANIGGDDLANFRPIASLEIKRVVPLSARSSSSSSSDRALSLAARDESGPSRAWPVPQANLSMTWTFRGGLLAPQLAPDHLSSLIRTGRSEIEKLGPSAQLPGRARLRLAVEHDVQLLLWTSDRLHLSGTDLGRCLDFLLDQIVSSGPDEPLALRANIGPNDTDPLPAEARLAVLASRSHRANASTDSFGTVPLHQSASLTTPVRRDAVWRYRYLVVPFTKLRIAYTLHGISAAYALASEALVTLLKSAKQDILDKDRIGQSLDPGQYVLVQDQGWEIVLSVARGQSLAWVEIYNCLRFLARAAAEATFDETVLSLRAFIVPDGSRTARSLASLLLRTASDPVSDHGLKRRETYMQPPPPPAKPLMLNSREELSLYRFRVVQDTNVRMALSYHARASIFLTFQALHEILQASQRRVAHLGRLPTTHVPSSEESVLGWAGPFELVLRITSGGSLTWNDVICCLTQMLAALEEESRQSSRLTFFASVLPDVGESPAWSARWLIRTRVFYREGFRRRELDLESRENIGFYDFVPVSWIDNMRLALSFHGPSNLLLDSGAIRRLLTAAQALTIRDHTRPDDRIACFATYHLGWSGLYELMMTVDSLPFLRWRDVLDLVQEMLAQLEREGPNATGLTFFAAAAPGRSGPITASARFWIRARRGDEGLRSRDMDKNQPGVQNSGLSDLDGIESRPAESGNALDPSRPSLVPRSPDRTSSNRKYLAVPGTNLQLWLVYHFRQIGSMALSQLITSTISDYRQRFPDGTRPSFLGALRSQLSSRRSVARLEIQSNAGIASSDLTACLQTLQTLARAEELEQEFTAYAMSQGASGRLKVAARITVAVPDGSRHSSDGLKIRDGPELQRQEEEAKEAGEAKGLRVRAAEAAALADPERVRLHMERFTLTGNGHQILVHVYFYSRYIATATLINLMSTWVRQMRAEGGGVDGGGTWLSDSNHDFGGSGQGQDGSEKWWRSGTTKTSPVINSWEMMLRVGADQLLDAETLSVCLQHLARIVREKGLCHDFAMFFAPLVEGGAQGRVARFTSKLVLELVNRQGGG